MSARSMFDRWSGASGATATVFGVLAGIGGMTHGVGEVLQGDTAVQGLALDSWTTGPIARNMGGEPGITVLPTAFWAGVTTVVLATAVILWSIMRVRERGGGLVLIILSTGMLLSGGGVGPPLIGILAGVVGRSGNDRPRPKMIDRASARSRRRWARVLPPLFVVAVANATFLVLGSLILVYAIDFNQPTLFEWSFYLTVLMLLALTMAAPAYDAAHRVGPESRGRAHDAERHRVGAGS